MSDGAFTCTVLNKAKRGGEANITIYEHGMMGGDISYSYSHRAPNNTANGFINVEADEYDLHLKMDSFRWSDHDGDKPLSPKEAAERLWIDFLSQAGITND